MTSNSNDTSKESSSGQKKMSSNGSGIYKTLLAASLTLNITGVTLHITEDRITQDDLETAFEAKVEYPWLQDRQLVMNHISDKGENTIHESDSYKRDRIQSVVSDELESLEVKVDNNAEDIKTILTKLDELGDLIRAKTCK